MPQIKFPHVKVSLKDLTYGVYEVIHRTAKAMKEAGVQDEHVETYIIQASQHDLARALVITAETVKLTRM